MMRIVLRARPPQLEPHGSGFSVRRPSASRRAAPGTADLAVLFSRRPMGSCATATATPSRTSWRRALSSRGRADQQDSPAAANLAARLGFETSSLTFRWCSATTCVASRPPSKCRSSSAEQPVWSHAGRAGHQPARRAPAGAGPHRRRAVAAWKRHGLVIVGADDKGTLAAANVVAARLPRLWNMTGITLSGLADQVRALPPRRGIDAARRRDGDRRRQ